MLRLLRLRLRLVRSSGDRGVALAMVVGIASVLLLLISLTMTFAVSGLVRSDHDADWDAAMSAAYAGVADYQSRMTNDPSYYQYGNKNAPFTIASGSASTVTAPPVTNAAFAVTAGGSWAPVTPADARIPVTGYFRYEVDNSKFQSNGVLRVRATGKVGEVTRSVVANIKQAGFTNYVYFTDYELSDPLVNSTSCTKIHAWETTTARDSGCVISFISRDTLDGQVHSNDTLNICAGTFKKRVTTANPKRDSSNRLYSQVGCSGTPTFSAGAPENASLITMPAVQQQLDQVRTDLTDKVPNPGCLYTGPTKITFTNEGGTAYMTVYSPWTKYIQMNGTSGVNTNTYCGKPGDPTKSLAQNAGTLSGDGGQKIAIGPATKLYNNLVYVQTIPSSSSNPNYWPSSKTPNDNSFSCGSGNGIGYPIANEVVSSKIPYGCSAGDVFIQGDMHGSMTINADHFAFITGKLKYVDSANDMLGLVGAMSVWVWNPIKCTATNSSGKCTDYGSLLSWEASSTSTSCARTINAAILSNDHSFEVQNYNSGTFLGYLCVTGSIAQMFRGPVGLADGSSGFYKSYSYDSRLLNSPPPRFPTPRTTSYDVTTEIEVTTAFGWNGAPL